MQAVELNPLEGHDHKGRSTTQVLQAIATDHDYDVKYSEAAARVEEASSSGNSTNFPAHTPEISQSQTVRSTSGVK